MSYQPQDGDVIADKYQLDQFVDEGGISKVWVGHDVSSGRKVAIKHPNYDSTNDPAIIDESLRSELEILESISDAGGHPNVMTLIEGMEHEDLLFLVVDFIEGEDMHKVVERRNGITDPGDIRRVGIDLSEAMSFLHQNEIIYRDLKPDNVMLKRDLTPVLIDFNTAKGFEPDDGESDATSGTVIPNPTYKPPELNNDPELIGYRQGPWSDVYSIGKLLMYMLSGSGVRKDAVDPRDFPGTRSVPAYLAEIIENATQKHKDDRYPNATVLARVLESRDPQPPEVGQLVHLQEGETYEIFPGDTVGRKDADGPQASITLDDPDNYISAVQVQFDIDENGDWVLDDRSLNGTWVNTGDGWNRVLGSEGLERLLEKGEDPREDGKMPPERMVIEEGDRIALVHPRYGVWLRFDG
ncbi:serine/threonine protein kinase [Halobacteriales archaeon QS_8_69_26]|nr:MAG: serine/threonine protein kinase [Halobacteriales archaeon QS_8_69_26]